ncbi:phenylalanine--tRNA ligase subunit beta [Hazenella sp. IB182357]|uniref:Phenylalanine--tRNA ligase beta subunit n=1 Tax=Polycladospora coralii TaxID=2771432 RepID=A0A926NBN9_9BACL|nr:phenylalanine--tRNA ligase subunit beta [Polycladospora coralii]MBD1372820.1 phenylalanine--tRNA ligase subunit beta [Polycladospora coralii]MBS7529482.1 phenylalanine--tRNA ligase subunit beta [Polycladospora coralii]
MLVSYEWLKEYVDLNGISPEDIAEEMNRTGIEVEVIYTRDAGVTGVTVGYVQEVTPHPEADRLQVCTVDVGKDQPLQIVCGATNIAAGQRVPVAEVGAKLPGDFKIKKAKLRGVDSFGMICSAKELGLPDKVLMKEQMDGILVLSEDAPIGTDIHSYMGMDDQVIELQLTPNRSDCLSMMGVAVEVAAIFDRELRLPQLDTPIDAELAETFRIEVESEADCPIYAAQTITDLRVGASPQWMQNRLISAGIRPINNIVDVTNYVMIETGQPLHAFDLGNLSGEAICIRRAEENEVVTTLDGEIRTCTRDTLMITDGEKPIALAGIMGGKNAEVTTNTQSILLESAYFDPTLTRVASRQTGLRTDASSRFEKGVDPDKIIAAIHRARQLLEQIAGGSASSQVVVKGSLERNEFTVDLRHSQLIKVLGMDVKEEQVMDIFRRLRLETEQMTDHYAVKIPSRRPDIKIEVDLIEEVARLYGYDQIPTSLLWGKQTPGGLTRNQHTRRIIRRSLRALGLNEVITYSLTSEGASSAIASLHENEKSIAIAMPMSNEHAYLRTSLLPHLIKTASYNVKHGNHRVRIFELGKTYITTEEQLTKLPDERFEVAGLVTGPITPSIWQKQQPQNDFFEMKGIIEAMLSRLGLAEPTFREESPIGFHPGRTAGIYIENQKIGLIGQLHPKLAQNMDLEETVVFQLDLETFLNDEMDDLIYAPIGKFPAVTRDLALVVDEAIPVGSVKEKIKEAGGALLEEITLFDVYVGEQVGEGKKSVAFSFVYRSKERTLTDEEVQAAHDAIVQSLEVTFDAKLR